MTATTRSDAYHTFLRAFGERLETLRRRRGLKQTALAVKVGCTRGTISRYERGMLFPGIVTLLRLRKTLEVSLDELVNGVPAPVRNPELVELFRALDSLPSGQIIRLLPGLRACLDAVDPETGSRRPAPPAAPARARRSPWTT